MNIVEGDFLRSCRGEGYCQYCGRFCPTREAHHWHKRSQGRLDIRINLILLGPTPLLHPCHRLMEEGKITSRQVLEKIAAREGVWLTSIIDAINCILGLDKYASREAIEREIGRLKHAEAKRLCREALEGAGKMPTLGAVHLDRRRDVLLGEAAAGPADRIEGDSAAENAWVEY